MFQRLACLSGRVVVLARLVVIVKLVGNQTRLVLVHFSLTNFVALPNLLGRELRGARMGDALSGAILRLFKWDQESSRPVENEDTVSMRNSCSKLVHLNGSNMLVLDVSFRDDLRMSCMWDEASNTDKRRESQWATVRLRARYCSGTMAFKKADFQTFKGLRTTFDVGGLLVAPAFPDPLGASLYHSVDLRILQPWSSWNPRSQKVAIIKGWLCRIFYLSSCSRGRSLAFEEAFASLCCLAGFPQNFVAQVARQWVIQWVSKRDAGLLQAVTEEVEKALRGPS